MRALLVVLAVIGGLAIVFVILSFVIRLLFGLVWLGIVVLLVCALVFLARSIARRRAQP
jgi:hypothetical protein